MTRRDVGSMRESKERYLGLEKEGRRECFGRCRRCLLFLYKGEEEEEEEEEEERVAPLTAKTYLWPLLLFSPTSTSLSRCRRCGLEN